ncbi:MAG: 50S ribosomal protein L9 [Chlamydiae bacterium]|nr:50S ribosomal protein L9 [Chlamydiota bacterium]
MQNQLLLLSDVENVGRTGDLVKVRPGFARNFLLPQKKAVVADKYTLKLQARLQQERAEQSKTDTQQALVLAERLQSMQLSMVVKVDPDGHMYGSVTAADIVKLLEKEGIALDRKNIVLPQPIREIGSHPVQLKLKEGVPAVFMLHIQSDRPVIKKAQTAVFEDIAPEDVES